MLKQGKYKFKSGAMSIIQMGEEQIGHPNTAINELVKNAYDADADKCIVFTFYDKNPDKNFLIIKDNGLGMDANTLFGDWLITSRSSKRDDEHELRRSKIYERRFLGSKGIGRLAAMALGQYLTVITKRHNESNYNWLLIDREDFRVEGLLDQIDFAGGEAGDYKQLFADEDFLKENTLTKNESLLKTLSEEVFRDFSEGTMIVLQRVDETILSIIERELNYKTVEQTSIYKNLVDLVTPLRLNSKIQNELIKKKIINEIKTISNGADTFQIYYGANFISDDFGNKLDIIEVTASNLIDVYDYRVYGKVTEWGEVVGEYECKRLLSPENFIYEEFNLAPNYLLSERDSKVRNLLEVKDLSEEYKSSDVGEFYFDIRIYDLDDDSKDDLSKTLNVRGRREAMQIMAKYVGLKISKNGFSVKPYGQEGQDWLGLGAERVKRHIFTIGPNQIIGYSFLYSPENDSLKEKTNREGFFENKAFQFFERAISGILDEAGRRRANFRLEHRLGRNKLSSKLTRPDTEKFIQYLSSKTKDNDILDVSKQFVLETNSALDNMQESLTFSQRLATLGTGLELVYHELSQPISSIGGSLNSLEKNIAKISDETTKQVLTKRVNNINQSVLLLDQLRVSLQPAIGRSVTKEFKPFETFKKVLYLFNDYITQNEILVNISGDLEKFSIKQAEYPFWISFLNIVNNAMYWLKFSEQNRILNLLLHETSTLVISNSGPKIRPNETDLIFEYGVTGKKERSATGLGLAFTRSMLSSVGWEIWAENVTYGPAFFIRKQD